MDFEICDEDDIALKSTFLGPQAENSDWVFKEVHNVFFEWFRWRRSQFPKDGSAISYTNLETKEFTEKRNQISKQLLDLSKRFENEIPKFSPRYIGHMFSEISLPALLGHLVALLHNPNNVSAESSLVGVQVENEAIQDLSLMIDYPRDSVGHFTSGGTIANFEALHRARMRAGLWFAANASLTNEFRPEVWTGSGWDVFDKSHELIKTKNLLKDFEKNNFATQGMSEFTKNIFQKFNKFLPEPVVFVPESKHYSWIKGVELLGYGQSSLRPIKLNEYGKLCVVDLRNQILECIKSQTPILMVVSILGTTELGLVDPIDQVCSLLNEIRENYGIHIWHHVDGAYGGYLCSLKNGHPKFGNVFSTETQKALMAVSGSDSISIDPHKLGYVPYASGTFIVKNERDYFLKSFGAPYVDFDNKRDKGPYTIEGSRPATGAVATWITSKSVGFNEQGYGRIIGRTILLRRNLECNLLESNLPIFIFPKNDTNIICFSVCQRDFTLSENNKNVQDLYNYLKQGANPFYVSKTKIDSRKYEHIFNLYRKQCGQIDTDEMSLIRIVIMNPFFKSKEMNIDCGKEFVQKLQSYFLGKSS